MKLVRNFLRKNRKLITIFLVILFLLLAVYMFSSMDYYETNRVSKDFIRGIVKVLYKSDNNQDLNQFVNRINTLVRKTAHAFLFFVLGTSISIVMKIKYKLEIKYNLMVLGTCFICGMLDEFHQSYVPGRSSKFSDVLIDTSGAILGIIIVNIIYKKIKPKYLKLCSPKKEQND